jgi:hypothetical protein
MRRAILLTGIALLIAACGPKKPTFHANLELAVEALTRASDYRDSGTLLFEPRLLDAEKAVAEMERTDGTMQDEVQTIHVQFCLSEIKDYRRFTAEGVRKISGDYIDKLLRQSDEYLRQ